MMTNSKEQDADKPFVCPVPGCKKRYKNVNGIKYHAKHGHKKEIRYVLTYLLVELFQTLSEKDYTNGLKELW